MTELPGNRETAYRVFAAEFDDATVDYQESDEERAPNYVVTPTGARANRLFVVGVLTEIESVNEDVLRARIVDPTGAFVVYAGQYQPDEMAALERLDPPAFVAVTGKARTFQPEDSDRVFTSIRPESINTVDAETRDRWVVRTAEHTVERVGTLAAAAGMDASGDDLRAALEASDVPAPTASGVSLALEHYGTTPAYLAGVHELAVDAAEVVAGDHDEVEAYDRSPSDAGDGTHTYADLAADLGDDPTGAATAGDRPDEPAAADTATPTDDDAAPEPTTEADAPSPGEAAGADATTETAAADDGIEDEQPPEAEESSVEAEESSVEAEESSVEADDSGVEADDSGVDDAASGADATDEDAADDEGDADDAVGETDAGDADDELDAAGEDDEGVGDFEPGSLGGDSEATSDQMYEFDEEERQEIEEEYGTEFASGNDVPEPEESDLDAPDPETVADDAGADAADAADATDAEADDAAAEAADEGAEDAADADEADEADDDADEEPAADVDVDVFVMDAMRELDDGDGVDRDALTEHVVDETGADEDAVADAIQDALMGGQCYEPEDDVLKPI